MKVTKEFLSKAREINNRSKEYRLQEAINRSEIVNKMTRESVNELVHEITELRIKLAGV